MYNVDNMDNVGNKDNVDNVGNKDNMDKTDNIDNVCNENLIEADYAVDKYITDFRRNVIIKEQIDRIEAATKIENEINEITDEVIKKLGLFIKNADPTKKSYIREFCPSKELYYNLDVLYKKICDEIKQFDSKKYYMRSALYYNVSCCEQYGYITLKVTPTKNNTFNRVRFAINKYIINCAKYTCCLLCICCSYSIIY